MTRDWSNSVTLYLKSSRLCQDDLRRIYPHRRPSPVEQSPSGGVVNGTHHADRSVDDDLVMYLSSRGSIDVAWTHIWPMSDIDEVITPDGHGIIKETCTSFTTGWILCFGGDFAEGGTYST